MLHYCAITTVRVASCNDGAGAGTTRHNILQALHIFYDLLKHALFSLICVSCHIVGMPNYFAFHVPLRFIRV